MQATLERLRKRREEEGDEGGFTLIELLIVIVILGILAAIVVFAVQNLSSSSSHASCGSDYKTVETAAEAYKAQLGAYPGGTISAAWTPAPSTAAAPTGYPAAYTAGMQALMGTASGGGGSPVGPWLKEFPFNAGHYSVGVSNDGVGTVSVTPPPTAAAPTDPCSGAT